MADNKPFYSTGIKSDHVASDTNGTSQTISSLYERPVEVEDDGGSWDGIDIPMPESNEVRQASTLRVSS